MTDEFKRAYDAGYNAALMNVSDIIRSFRSKGHTDTRDLLNDLADAADDLTKVIPPRLTGR